MIASDFVFINNQQRCKLKQLTERNIDAPGLLQKTSPVKRNRKRNRLTDWRWWIGLGPKYLRLLPRKDWEVTVLIPAFNEAKSIGLTILSVQRQTFPVKEIIVIDDCSTDNTGAIAKKFGATVLRTPRNSGTKAQALNFALEGIQTEFVCVVDGDTLLKRDAIEKLLPAFYADQVIAACGFVTPQNVKTFWERARFIEYLLANMLYKRAQNHIGAVFVCSGCFSIFRTQSLMKKCGFNERTIAEDMDLSWGLLEEKGEIAFMGNAVCYPVDPPNIHILVAQLDRWYRGYLQCLKVRHGWLRNWKLAMIAYWYLFDFVFGWIAIVIGLSWYTRSFLQGIGWSFAVQVFFVCIVSLAQGALMGKFRTALTSIPCYFPLFAVNSFVLWKSIVLEIFLGRKLAVWKKGH